MAKPVQIQRESRRSRRRIRGIAWKCVLLLCTMQLLTSKVMRSKQEQQRAGSGAEEVATGDATSKGTGTEPFSKSSSEDAVRESEAKREMRMLLLLEKEQGEVIIERLCCAVPRG